jgi:hypothetical protein
MATVSLEKAKDKLGMNKVQLAKAMSLNFNFNHLQ